MRRQAAGQIGRGTSRVPCSEEAGVWRGPEGESSRKTGEGTPPCPLLLLAVFRLGRRGQRAAQGNAGCRFRTNAPREPAPGPGAL